MELAELIYQLNTLIGDADQAVDEDHMDFAREQLQRAKDLLDKEFLKE